MEYFDYSIANDTANRAVGPLALKLDIQQSGISVAISHLETSGDLLRIWFYSALGTQDRNTLDALVAAHDGVELVPPDPPVDSVTGAPLISTKKIPDNWYYQLRTFSFETSKLNSVVDVNHQFSPYGVIDVSYLDASQNVLNNPTQQTLDSSCQYTVLTFQPNTNWGIRGGLLAQLSLPANPLYVWAYVTVMTGQNSSLVVGSTSGGFDFRFVDSRKFFGANEDNFQFFSNNDSITFKIKHETGLQHSMQALLHLSFPIGS